MRSKTQKKAHTHTDALPAKQSIERCSPDFHCGLKMLPSPNPMHDDQAPRELTALQLARTARTAAGRAGPLGRRGPRLARRARARRGATPKGRCFRHSYALRL